MHLKTSGRTAFIHIGGAKTGSDSIQKTLKYQNLPEHHFIQGDSAYHSSLLSLLFVQDETTVPHGFAGKDGATRRWIRSVQSGCRR